MLTSILKLINLENYNLFSFMCCCCYGFCFFFFLNSRVIFFPVVICNWFSLFVYMHAVLVISSVQSNLLLKNLF